MEMLALTWTQVHINFLWMEERLHDISDIVVIFSTYFLQKSNYKDIESDSAVLLWTCRWREVRGSAQLGRRTERELPMCINNPAENAPGNQATWGPGLNYLNKPEGKTNDENNLMGWEAYSIPNMPQYSNKILNLFFLVLYTVSKLSWVFFVCQIL